MIEVGDRPQTDERISGCRARNEQCVVARRVRTDALRDPRHERRRRRRGEIAFGHPHEHGIGIDVGGENEVTGERHQHVGDTTRRPDDFDLTVGVGEASCCCVFEQHGESVGHDQSSASSNSAAAR